MFRIPLMKPFVDQAGNVGESLELAQRAWELARRRVGESGLAATRMQNTVAYRLEELGDVLQVVVQLIVRALGRGVFVVGALQLEDNQR